MTEEQEKQKKNAQLLLFVDFDIEPEKAKAFLDNMEQHPEKIEKYNKLLSKSLSEQYEIIKQKTVKELTDMAKERAAAWKKMIGPVTLQEYVAMSKQWDVPIDGIIDEKITPELIKGMLDFFVMGQEKYKIKLSVAFYTYMMHGAKVGLNLPKSNLVVCGPSGSGKTYGMQILSKLFHVPFVLIHCNSVVQEGIIGPGLTDGFTALITQGWLKEEVEHAVVCFDEFDKLFEKNHQGHDSGYFNARVVNEMLNIIDDNGEVEFKDSFDKDVAKPMRVPSRKMMFVFTGVFDGLRNNPAGPQKEQQNARRKIGYLVNNEPEDEQPTALEEPTFDDFIEFGVKPEILGRAQNFVFLNELTEDEMVALFDLGGYSPFTEFEQYFSYNGINAILTQEGKHTLARLAIERRLGVRGLKSLLQQVLMEDMYDLDVGEDNILKVTKRYILDNLNS